MAYQQYLPHTRYKIWERVKELIVVKDLQKGKREKGKKVVIPLSILEMYLPQINNLAVLLC